MGSITPLNFRTYYFIIIALVLLTFIAVLSGLLIGSTDISLSDLRDIIYSGDTESSNYTILFEIRLPRVLLALAVGGGLSVAGAVFQAILMNPLAEPYILGISSGSAFGAILALFLGLSFWWMELLAFSGALAVIGIVFYLGRRFGEIQPGILLLSGVMIGAFFAALILLLITLLNESLRTAIFWLVGNLSLATSDSVSVVLPVTIVISAILVFNGQKFNVLAMGSEYAKHLGINASRLKNLSYLLSSLMIGAVVSVSGIIGFVGLIIPHICRLLFGYDNRVVIPASFFIGATFLILADAFARAIISPAELPVGGRNSHAGCSCIYLFAAKKLSFAIGLIISI